MKRTYVLRFLHRGALFGSIGPIIAGIVYLSISLSLEGFLLTGPEVFVAILSTYLLAFLHAGASVFNQIEHWPIAKSTFFHFLTLYVSYLGCYLLNSWLPFDWIALLIFTLIFAVAYLAVWLTVFLTLKAVSRRLNSKLH